MAIIIYISAIRIIEAAWHFHFESFIVYSGADPEFWKGGGANCI